MGGFSPEERKRLEEVPPGSYDNIDDLLADISDDEDDEADDETGEWEREYDALGIDDPDEVDGFGHLETPDWLDEASFYAATEMADDVEGVEAALGWGPHSVKVIATMVEVLDVEGVDLP